MKQINAVKNFLFLVLFLSPVFLLADSLQMKLPLHINISAQTNHSPSFQKDDFTLFINGSQREIYRLESKTRQMNKTSDLSRHFVLSFHMDEFNQDIMTGVQYFIDNILDRTDTLTVLSPTKSYQMNLNKGKAAVFDAIVEHLKEDCYEYKMKRAPLLQKLEKEIFQVRKLEWNDANFLRASTIIFNFYNFCQQAITDLRLHFLSPYSQQDRVIKELPPKGDGETWWIHFQQQSFLPTPPRLKVIVGDMIRRQTAGGLIGSKNYEFAQLKKDMNISSEFPLSPILEELLKDNICYNVIFWGDINYINSQESELSHPEIKDIFSKMTTASGGKLISTHQPKQGLIELQQHVDQFYQLEFPFNDKIEPKKINLVLANQEQSKKVRLSYPQQYEKEKIQSLVETLSREKVKIIDFTIKGNRVDFGVTSFHSKPPEITGLLKVRAELYNEQEGSQPVFSTGNTLHAAKESIRISFPLPKTYTGPFKVRVSICDVIANQLDIVEQRIIL